MRLSRFPLTLAFVVLTCTTLQGQSTAQVSGTARDQSGAVLPGVEVSLTQTNTGLVRTVVTNETGSYAMPNLPVGPYKLEASLPGFRTYVQTGIVLQVNANPVINIVMDVGQVSETVSVQADAALVETRSTGIGQVIDNVRVLELPLNARQVTELIILSGTAVGGGNQTTNRNYPSDTISVGGGSNDGLTFLLDGGTHNDSFTQLNLPLPFPDAMQEFKVETSAVPAQYGEHAGGAVNVVTKSGTNVYHGALFEFLRNRVFNARNSFALERDGLKRNQFGGVLGGPIIKNKLFFFGGDQVTIQRSQPAQSIAFVPTPAMLAGDWTAVASPACNGGRQIALVAPFQNNRINPALFSTPALNLAKHLPSTADPCGKVVYKRINNSDEHLIVGRVDYQPSGKHLLFGRYELGHLFTPTDYDGENPFVAQSEYLQLAHSFVLGDTYTIGSALVSSFRGTLLRPVNTRTLPDFFTLSDLGVKNTYYPAGWPKMTEISVSGAFSTVAATATPTVTNSTIYQFAEDLSWVKGTHQLGFGVNHIHTLFNLAAGTSAPGSFTFSAQNTGLPLGDLMLGRPSAWSQNDVSPWYMRQNYIGLYLQDTWKTSSHLTLNGGVRWEPYLPAYDPHTKTAHFEKSWFDQDLRSTVFKNAPAGVLFAGDAGVPSTDSVTARQWMHFAPRLGLAWDPKGDGLMTIRAAYGILFDYPKFGRFGGIRNTPPRNILISLPNPIGGFEDPWQGYPGGNPFPATLGPNTVFPTFTVYTPVPLHLKSPYMNQWNLSIQKQIGADWLVSGNYIGNNIIHLLDRHELNPAIYDPRPSCVIAGRTYTPCSQIANTNQRRVLYLQNPGQGQYYSNIVIPDDGGTRSYNALVLSVQRRRSRGITIQANYTWSHCIDDGWIDSIQSNGGRLPERRRADRGNCELDRRHNFNASAVYETPRFSNRTLRILGGGWQLSGIVRVLAGPYLTVASGLDNALSGTTTTAVTADQRPNQILPSPYAPNKSVSQWMNPAAFAQPAVGTYGTMGRASVRGPGNIGINAALTRKLQLRENQSLEFRAEAFNLPNHVNLSNPNVTLTDPVFGRILSAGDPRTMQMALRYVF